MPAAGVYVNVPHLNVWGAVGLQDHNYIHVQSWSLQRVPHALVTQHAFTPPSSLISSLIAHPFLDPPIMK